MILFDTKIQQQRHMLNKITRQLREKLTRPMDPTNQKQRMMTWSCLNVDHCPGATSARCVVVLCSAQLMMHNPVIDCCNLLWVHTVGDTLAQTCEWWPQEAVVSRDVHTHKANTHPPPSSNTRTHWVHWKHATGKICKQEQKEERNLERRGGRGGCSAHRTMEVWPRASTPSYHHTRETLVLRREAIQYRNRYQVISYENKIGGNG